MSLYGRYANFRKKKNNYMMKSIKKLLTNKIDMKDLCVADVILEIKITMIFDGLVLYQSYYIEKIIVKVYKSEIAL
jgi:hypothetical protein